MRDRLIDAGMDEYDAANYARENNPLSGFFEFGDYGVAKLKVDAKGRGVCTITDWDDDEH